MNNELKLKTIRLLLTIIWLIFNLLFITTGLFGCLPLWVRLPIGAMDILVLIALIII